MADTAVAILFDDDEIARRVDELAETIAAALPPSFTLVGLLKGSFVFVADLGRALSRAGCACGSSSCGSPATAAAPPARASSA